MHSVNIKAITFLVKITGYGCYLGFNWPAEQFHLWHVHRVSPPLSLATTVPLTLNILCIVPMALYCVWWVREWKSKTRLP